MDRRLQRPGLDTRHHRVGSSRRRTLWPGASVGGQRGIAVLVAAPLIPVLILLIIMVSVVVGCSDQKKQAVSLTRVALQHRELNRHAEAIQVLNRAIAIDPKLSEAWYLRGLSHAELKHSRESVTDLTSAVRIRPDWDEAWWALGAAQRSTGETALAIKSYSEAIRLTPKFVAALFDRACAYGDFGDREKSLADLDTVLRLDPDHDDALLRQATLLAESRPDEAIRNLNGVLAHDRENAAAWMLRGLCWHRSGDTERALTDLNIACRMRADDFQPWLERGRVLRASGRTDDAISDLSMAVQLGPAAADCHYELARAFADAGNVTAALANLNQALTIDPDHAEAWLARARLAASGGEHDKALLALEALSKVASSGAVNPDLACRITLERSRSLIATGQHERALQELQSVLTAEPLNPEALQLRAEVLSALNRSDEAIADYTRLISLSSKPEPMLLQRRAELFTQLGETEAAMSDLLRLADQLTGDEAVALKAALRIRDGHGADKAVEFLNRVAAARNDGLPSSLGLLRSELRLQCGDPDGAEQDLDRLIVPDSASVRARAVRAGIAVHRNQDKLAVELLSGVAEDDMTPELLLLRGAAKSRLGMPEEAAADFSTVLLGEPENVTARLARAAAYVHQQSWATALADAQTVLDQTEQQSAAYDPQTQEARRIRGVSLFHLGRFDDAIRDLDSPEILNRDSLNLHWMRCQCLHELNQDFRAMAELDRFIDSAPDHEPARLLRARLAEEQGRFEVAVKDLSCVIGRQPQHETALMQRGLLLHRRGQFEAAVSDFDQVLTLRPAAADVFYRRGLARHQLGQDEQAVEDLNHCLLLNSQCADAVYVKANIEAGRGDIDAALALYAKALEIAPTHAAAWYNRGNLLFNKDDFSGSVECWTKAVEFQPDLFRAYNNRAAALAKLGRTEEAVRDYEHALELSPGFARAWDNYAWLLATSEDPVFRDTTRAVFMAKKACELTGHQDWTCLSTLAAAYAEAGDMPQAAGWAKKSRELAPTDQQAELEKLVRLYETGAVRPAKASTATRSSGTRRQ